MSDLDRRTLPAELRQAAILLSEWLNGGGTLQVRPRSCDNLRAAADEIDRMRADLKNIAAQKTTDEMDEQENEDADFTGAYDALIHIARRALQPLT